MRIRVPDDDDDDETVAEVKVEPVVSVEEKISFREEITDILKIPKKSPKFLVEGPVTDTLEFKLQMLMKFTEFCREEIIPRHAKAMEAIRSKSEELECTMEYQQREMAFLRSTSREMREDMLKLQTKQSLALTQHRDLNERLKDTFHRLQNCCKTKTFAEKKMAQDLVYLKKRAEDLNIRIKESSSKVNYYVTQVKAQTAMVKKQVKPLHLDKARTAFIKTNLNSSRLNIEESVRRVKTLKKQLSEIEEPEYSEAIPNA